MKLLRNLVGCMVMSIMIAVGFRGADFISSSYASSFGLAKQNAFLRSVKIYSMESSWSGLIYKKNNESGFLILTIIHKETMSDFVSSGFPYLVVTMESGEKHFAEVAAWDSCNEVAMIKVIENDSGYIPKIIISNGELNYGFPLFTMGHPLGEGLHYAEGVMSSKNTIISDCGASTDGFSSTILPGSTGSGVYDNNGRLVGLVIATSTYQVYNQNQLGEIISVGSVPQSEMGLYIPADTISLFLTENGYRP